jgi:hypothetical protein
VQSLCDHHQSGRGVKAERGWKRHFEDPIALPSGRTLHTLMDAATYITKLPEAEHTAPEWQAAMEALMLVAELGGPTMFARIGVMRALNRHVDRVFNPDRKEHHWGRRKLARSLLRIALRYGCCGMSPICICHRSTA